MDKVSVPMPSAYFEVYTVQIWRISKGVKNPLLIKSIVVVFFTTNCLPLSGPCVVSKKRCAQSHNIWALLILTCMSPYGNIYIYNFTIQLSFLCSRFGHSLLPSTIGMYCDFANIEETTFFGGKVVAMSLNFLSSANSEKNIS